MQENFGSRKLIRTTVDNLSGELFVEEGKLVQNSEPHQMVILQFESLKERNRQNYHPAIPS